MVESTIKNIDPKVGYKDVQATRGKQVRAEPVQQLYEAGQVHHVGHFPDLEKEMCRWVPGDNSPNRLDSATWAITELMGAISRHGTPATAGKLPPRTPKRLGTHTNRNKTGFGR